MSWVPNDDRFNFSLDILSRVCLFGMQYTLRVHMKYMYECGGMHEPGDQRSTLKSPTHIMEEKRGEYVSD